MATYLRAVRDLLSQIIVVPLLIFTTAPSTAIADGSTGTAQLPAAFRTKHARFEPAFFDALPGWQDDRLGDAWHAFRKSCAALVTKPEWQPICARSAQLGAGNEAVLRQFFEQEFDLFQIHNADMTPAGVITGYYEPQLSGSRRPSAATPYPVYAVPDDLLFLDARLVPANGSVGLPVRLDGRTVLPVYPNQAVDKVYRLDLSGIEPDSRTRKYRLRVDGERIVPYLSRQDIERAPLTHARVIAWVGNRAALYSMQLQGSGKIQLPDGKIIRVGYAEQNGHVFRPSVLASTRFINGKGASQGMLTRGLGTANNSADAPAALSKAEMMALFTEATPDTVTSDESPRTRGLGRIRRGEAVGSVSEVDRMVAMLMQSGQGKGAGAASSAAKGPDSVDADVSAAASTPLKTLPLTIPVSEAPPSTVEPVSNSPAATAAPAEQTLSPTVPSIMAAPTLDPSRKASLGTHSEDSLAPRHDAPLRQETYSGGASFALRQHVFNGDPSFVFFREIPNTADGPIGALGIPLTAGRSLAVDPRTTPLGFPVFLSTRDPARKQVLNRLMLAQDTGGAIRGAVRADYFWGFGEHAFAQASQMKEDGKLWLLLPKLLRRPAGVEGPKVRGMGLPLPALSECVVADADFCVE